MRALVLAVLLAAPAIPRPAAAVEPASLEAVPRLTVADVLERGDRAYAGGDLRAALFAYQDAVNLEPTSAGARVRLARTYLALRYPAQARVQAEQALALDAGSDEARRLLEDAKSGRVPAHRTVAPPEPAAGDAARAAPGGRDGGALGAAEAPAAATAGAATANGATASAAKVSAASAAMTGASAATVNGATAAPVVAPTEASLRYRAGVDLLLRREYALAVEALDLAIAADRRLGVAYAARGSAQLGLGRAREAAHDYRAAIELEPGLAMPLYGLAECYRAMGHSLDAADLYRRYAESRAADVREDLRTLAVKRAAERVVH